MTALGERALLIAGRSEVAAAHPAHLDEQKQALEAVRQVLNGNREAFRWVVETYQSSVYNLALRLLGDPTEAEDVAQETFVRAYLHLGSYRAEYRFRAWLLSIAAHLCIDRLRRRKHEPALLEDTPVGDEETGTDDHRALVDPAPLPDEVIAGKQRAALVQAMLDSLPPLDRTLVVMAYLDELRLEEIAQALHLSVSAVKSRLFRARQKMSRSKWAALLKDAQ